MNFVIKHYKKTVFLSLTALVLTACTGTDPEVEKKMTSNKIRNQAIQESAVRFGAQSGLYWQAHNISQELKAYESPLERIYHFSALMMPDHMLPPVVVESYHNLQLNDPNTMRSSQWVVEIKKPAKLVTVPPTYRDYLTWSFKKPELPDATLQPQNDQEWILWNQSVKTGWEQGISQANQLFTQALYIMTEDLNGMALYHLLYTQNMISKPFVSSAKLGITGDKHRMAIEDRILKITAHSGLKIKDSEHWKAALSQED